MGAWDTIEKTIRDDNWPTGEQVIIRELTYGELTKINTIAMQDMTLGVAEDDEQRRAMKLGQLTMEKRAIEKMRLCIVSWTLKKNSKILPVNDETINTMSSSYGEFIAEQIEELNPERDEKFPVTGGDGDKGKGQAAA